MASDEEDDKFLEEMIAKLGAMGALGSIEEIFDKIEGIDPIDELAKWAHQVDAIPGCLGALLKTIHAALVDVYANPMGSGSREWTLAEFERWMPVVSIARHFTEDVLES